MDLTTNERRCLREYEERREADEINSRHRLPIRFAKESEFMCRHCGDVDVADEGELCAECQIEAEESAREDYYEHQRELREGR